MAIFNKAQHKFTTKNFQIGAPEAEAETTAKSKIKLSDVFEDYLSILPELETEKFIVIGRKGSGKTAIGEHLYFRSLNKPNEFCEFVRKIDIDIQQIVQIGIEKGNEIQKELLFKWIILTKLLKLISNNEAVQCLKGIKELKEFIKRNSGFVDIRSFELKEIITQNGFEVKVDYLNRVMAKFNKDVRFKGERASFVKLLPHLEEIVIDILASDEDADNNYIIVFDDLDIGFKSENPDHLDTLVNLIRICKDYNNNLFGKKATNAKVILLLRDDIARHLKENDSDTAKIFSSYSIQISWYEHSLFKIDENLINLKKFINKRIERNFIANRIPLFSGKGHWSSLVEEDSIYYKDSSFKYVLEHTFYKPRDIILFFKPLSDFQFEIPLKPDNIKTLLGKYSLEAIEEIKNELLLVYNIKEIKAIINALEALANLNCFKYQDLIEKLSTFIPDRKPEDIIEQLFQYSLIGNKETGSKMVYFKYREERSDEIRIDKEKEFILPYILKIYFKNK